jgi:hypothetical protein
MKYLSFAFSILLLSSHVEAQLVNTVSEYDGTANGNGTTIAAQPNLVSAYGSLSSGDFTPYQTASIGILNDGSLGTGGNNPVGTALTNNGTPWTLTINLNTSVNTAGYTITGLDAFTGWTGDYVDQNYTVSYSTTSAPTTFIPLGTYTATANASRSALVTLESSLAPASNNLDIATNVAALQYTFSVAPEDSGHVEAYTEIEALGSPVSVPEPSTYTLVVVALFAMLGINKVRSRSSMA